VVRILSDERDGISDQERTPTRQPPWSSPAPHPRIRPLARVELRAVAAWGFRPPQRLDVSRSGRAGDPADASRDTERPGLRQTWSLFYRTVAETPPAVVAPFAIYLLEVIAGSRSASVPGRMRTRRDVSGQSPAHVAAVLQRSRSLATPHDAVAPLVSQGEPQRPAGDRLTKKTSDGRHPTIR
jgi:hypothetical protein